MFKFFRARLTGFSLLPILLLAACGNSNGDGEEAAPPDSSVQPVEVATVSRGDLTETLVVVGSVTANESTSIRPEISGLIQRIRFEEGALVEEDEPLVQLDDRELQAELREASVRLELAKQTYERNEALVATQSVSQSDRDRALAELERTRAEVDKLKVRLEKTVIRAPFAGRIGARNVSPGNLVEPSDSIARLEDLSRLKVEFALPDRHADQVQQGAEIQLSSGRNSGISATGVIYFISPVIDRSTRTVEVKAYVEDPPAAFRPGTFLQVEVVLEQKEGVLTVPETAVLAHEGAYVLVAVERDDAGNDVAAFRPVRLGLRQEGRVEVTPVQENGLAAGQEVVGAGVGALPIFPGARLEGRPMKSIHKEADSS